MNFFKRSEVVVFFIFYTLVVFLSTSSRVLAGSWQQNVSIGGFNNVHIYTPDSQSSVGEGKALLIVLHGCVQPINNFLTAQLETAAEQFGMVVAVPDAMNKAGFSCWSYWTGSKSRNAGDYKNLIDLANTMSSDSQRGIDSNQIYIAGLSSGAAFAATTACVAPDIFAGVASSAGPTIGTSSSGALNTCEVVSPNTFKSRCESYAGSYQASFDNQLAVVAHANNDPTVDDCYNQQNANGYAKLYGDLTQLSGSTVVSDSNGQTAEQYLFENNRIAMLWFDDAVGHAWSGGQGANGGYISDQAINFASYLGQHFSENNLRVDRNEAPEFYNLSTSENDSKINVSGNAIDNDGQVANVNIRIINLGDNSFLQEINTTTNPNNDNFSATSQSLSDGLYRVELIATDDLNSNSQVASLLQRVGPEPAATAPTLSNINASVAGQCASVTGTVVDINLDLGSVVVSFSNGDVTATISNDQYSAERCNLSGGNNTAQVIATDLQNLSSNDSISFDIDAGVTGDYNLHISLGNITWGVGYSACYLEFGANAFTMREYSASNNQCQWIADGAASCSGPLQACSGGGSSPTDSDNDGINDEVDNCPNTANGDQLDNDNDGIGNVCDPTPDVETGGSCEEFTTFNYYHKTAGRAYSIGFFSPVYYAEGTDDLIAGSTWGTTTLSSVDDGANWRVSNCP